MPEFFFRLLPVLLLAGLCNYVHADVSPDWYRSNAAGMALEYIPSRSAALRSEYCLSVIRYPAQIIHGNPGAEMVSGNFQNDAMISDGVLVNGNTGDSFDALTVNAPFLDEAAIMEFLSSIEIPSILVPFYDPHFSVELRVLFENARPCRHQWNFRDQNNITRLNASGDVNPRAPADEFSFVEIFDENHFLSEEFQNLSNGGRLTKYTYSGSVLVKAETWINEESGAQRQTAYYNSPYYLNLPDYVDLYRYTRSSSLRAIERIYREPSVASQPAVASQSSSASQPVRIPFPGLAPGAFSEPDFMNPGMDYSSLFLDDVKLPEDSKSVYSFDSRGRIISEMMLDSSGEVWAEIRNTWSGDRLGSIHWKSGDDEKLTEYEYDSQGNRIIERNYSNGELERLVRASGNRETEELYINGRMMLRAVYEDGRKVSEERFRR